MRLFRAIALIFISVLFFQCQKEISSAGQPDQVVTTPDPISARLQGNVYDENDQPAAGVSITVGSQTTTTDSKGNFRFDLAALDKKSGLVTADKSGYFKAYRVIAATSGTNYVAIKLVKKTLIGTIDAASGGSVTLSNGSKIALPANGVVNASNSSAYTGTVNVYAAYIDPTAADISKTVPGSFMAEDLTGKRVTLSSYGMMAVELQSTSAEKLQIKSGSVATLTTPIPSSIQTTAPATIALWSVDEQTGIWKEEGAATKNGNVYVGDVKHFSFWNCDVSANAITLSMTVKTPNNQPIVHAHVRITTTTGYIYSTYGWTDSLGQVSGYIPNNQALVLAVLDPCGNAVYTQNIGPYTSNTNLGVITVTIPSNASLTVTGHLSNCSAGNVTNGFAIIYYNNVVRYAGVDASGNFSSTFITCAGTPSSIQILGVDNGGGQQGNLGTVTVTTPVTSAGNISACGNSALQWVTFKLDGIDSLYNQPTDSLMAYTSSPQGTTQYNTYINASHNAPPFGAIFLNFNHPALAAGSYPLTALNMSNTTPTTIIQPFNVVVTNFPQNVGEFYEGTFSGSYVKLGVTHVITNGSFRIRKTF